MAEQKKGYRCVLCRFEVPEGDVIKYPMGISGCPHCGTRLLPMRIEHDIEVSLNWQDIRVLAIYAKRFTRFFNPKQKSEQESIQALDELIDRLDKYKPEGAMPLRAPEELQKKGEEKKGDDTDKRCGAIVSPFY